MVGFLGLLAFLLAIMYRHQVVMLSVVEASLPLRCSDWITAAREMLRCALHDGLN
jgi:hypothetical protein